jgi:chorismate-pyruvate lyase
MQARDQNSVSDSHEPEYFDPLKDVLMAQFAKPAEMGAVNLRALNPFQRAMLIIDGTVTTFLEVYTLEPVELKLLSHMSTTLTADNEWLDVEKGSEVVLREVMIQGRQSHALYAYAVASVALERLPDEVSEKLAAPGGSLGRVLNEQKIETRRELLWYGREKNENLPAVVRKLHDGSFVCRTYRIFSGGMPIALIHEKFPASIDRFSSLE